MSRPSFLDIIRSLDYDIIVIYQVCHYGEGEEPRYLPVYSVIPVDPEVLWFVEIVREEHDLRRESEIVIDIHLEIDLQLGTELKFRSLVDIAVNIPFSSFFKGWLYDFLRRGSSTITNPPVIGAKLTVSHFRGL